LASHLMYPRPQRQGASTGSGEGPHAREPEASDWHTERYVPQRA
jgi:hypothetical protein